MLDLTTDFGRKVQGFLDREYVIWLTTVGTDLTPQPRPVWFIWQDGSILIYSQRHAHKVRHLAARPRVALHFNTDVTGDKDVIVFTGRASMDPAEPPPHLVPAYLEKYRTGIAGLPMTPEEFGREYPVAIRVQLGAMRGW
jgi:PPOX class probable F420-dependent enzyme